MILAFGLVISCKQKSKTSIKLNPTPEPTQVTYDYFVTNGSSKIMIGDAEEKIAAFCQEDKPVSILLSKDKRFKSIAFKTIGFRLVGSENEYSIDRVTFTGTDYKLPLGIKIGDTLESLLKAYPAEHRWKKDESGAEIYDLTGPGDNFQSFVGVMITFYIDNNRISRIDMHIQYD